MVSVSQKFPLEVKSLFQSIYLLNSILRCYSSLLSQKIQLKLNYMYIISVAENKSKTY